MIGYTTYWNQNSLATKENIHYCFTLGFRFRVAKTLRVFYIILESITPIVIFQTGVFYSSQEY